MRQGPGEGIRAREMLEMAMVLATFECDVTVILQEAAVRWTQLPQFTSGHPHALSGRLKSLPLYDIDNVLVDHDALSTLEIEMAADFPGSAVEYSDIEAVLTSVEVVLEA